jgi:hypothetical protein
MKDDKSHSASLRGLRDKGPVEVIDFDGVFVFTHYSLLMLLHFIIGIFTPIFFANSIASG